MSQIKEIIDIYNNNFERWSIKISKKQYEEARLIAANNVKLCRKIILFDPNVSEQIKNISLAYGIGFRGLEELTDLAEIAAEFEWYQNHKSVEHAWFLLQNCKDRFESSFPSIPIPKNIKETIYSFIEVLNTDFLTLFGSGLYVSPEIIIKKSVCSICKRDFRTCPHLPNHVYSGKICRMEPTEILPGDCVVILSHPKDPRCRLWPWHIEKDGSIIHDVPLIISFKVDDFLD